jgi:hypothetical protein
MKPTSVCYDSIPKLWSMGMLRPNAGPQLEQVQRGTKAGWSVVALAWKPVSGSSSMGGLAPLSGRVSP